jgi:hypothetical protein
VVLSFVIVEFEDAQRPVADAATAAALAPRPTTAELRLLTDSARYIEAVALLKCMGGSPSVACST